MCHSGGRMKLHYRNVYKTITGNIQLGNNHAKSKDVAYAMARSFLLHSNNVHLGGVLMCGDVHVIFYPNP